MNERRSAVSLMGEWEPFSIRPVGLIVLSPNGGIEFEVAGYVDNSHPDFALAAGADGGEDFIGAEFVAGGKGHFCQSIRSGG